MKIRINICTTTHRLKRPLASTVDTCICSKSVLLDNGTLGSIHTYLYLYLDILCYRRPGYLCYGYLDSYCTLVVDTIRIGNETC